MERTGSGMLEIAPGVIAAPSLTRTDLLERDGMGVTSPVALDAAFVNLRVH